MKKTNIVFKTEGSKRYECNASVMQKFLAPCFSLAEEVEQKLRPKEDQLIIWSLCGSSDIHVKSLDSGFNLCMSISLSRIITPNSIVSSCLEGLIYKEVSHLSSVHKMWISKDGEYISCNSGCPYNNHTTYGKIRTREGMVDLIVACLGGIQVSR